MKAIAKNFFLLIAAFLFSCQKQNMGGNGNVLVTITDNGQLVYPAVVYAKYGSNPDHADNISAYDYFKTGDPYGQAQHAGF